MIKQLLLRISLVVIIATPAAATFSSAAEKLFPPAYQVGKRYEFEMSSNVTMDMTAMGAATGTPGAAGKTKVDMKMTMIITCAEHETPGHKLITTTYSRIQMAMDMGTMKMNFDSSDPDSADSPFAAAMKPLMDMEIVVILDEKGNVIEISGFEKMGAMQQFDEEQLKQMMDPAKQLGIADEGVMVGDTWDNLVDMPMGKTVGNIKMKMTMKYEKDETIDGVNCAVVSYIGTMDMKIGDTAKPAMMMGMEAGELKGTMIFDKNSKVIKEGTSTGSMKMTMPNPTDSEKKLTIPMELKQIYRMKSISVQ